MVEKNNTQLFLFSLILNDNIIKNKVLKYLISLPRSYLCGMEKVSAKCQESAVMLSLSFLRCEHVNLGRRFPVQIPATSYLFGFALGANNYNLPTTTVSIFASEKNFIADFAGENNFTASWSLAVGRQLGLLIHLLVRKTWCAQCKSIFIWQVIKWKSLLLSPKLWLGPNSNALHLLFVWQLSVSATVRPPEYFRCCGSVLENRPTSSPPSNPISVTSPLSDRLWESCLINIWNCTLFIACMHLHTQTRVLAQEAAKTWAWKWTYSCHLACLPVEMTVILLMRCACTCERDGGRTVLEINCSDWRKQCGISIFSWIHPILSFPWFNSLCLLWTSEVQGVLWRHTVVCKWRTFYLSGKGSCIVHAPPLYLQLVLYLGPISALSPDSITSFISCVLSVVPDTRKCSPERRQIKGEQASQNVKKKQKKTRGETENK